MNKKRGIRRSLVELDLILGGLNNSLDTDLDNERSYIFHIKFLPFLFITFLNNICRIKTNEK